MKKPVSRARRTSPPRRARRDQAGEILRARTYGAFERRLRTSGCRLCALHAARTQIVVDRGAPEAPILVIGEGPGVEEDRQGRAFVGRSGRLLDAMMEEAGIDPARDVLIANVVKCRPPENRVPRRDEVAACLPFLERQIELSPARVVVLLGGTAVRHVIPSHRNEAMGELAGRVFRTEAPPKRDVLVTYHPAFVLRAPSKRPDVVRHLRALAPYARNRAGRGKKSAS